MNTRIAARKLIPIVIGATAAMAAQAGSRGAAAAAEELEFEVAEIYLELNDTDGDLGIHGLIDGDAWKSLEIEGPDGRVLMNAWIRGALRRQGMTEFSFESDEPSFDELSPEEFFLRFPEGTYEIDGITLDGDEIEGEAELSHVLAGPPANVMVNRDTAAANCDAELPSVREPVTIDWDAVTQSHPTLGTTGVAVTVQKYELVGEIEREGETPDVLVFKADLPPEVTSFELPEDFTSMADGEIKFEIVTRLDNGNQTAIESCFELE